MLKGKFSEKKLSTTKKISLETPDYTISWVLLANQIISWVLLANQIIFWILLRKKKKYFKKYLPDYFRKNRKKIFLTNKNKTKQNHQ